MNVNDVNINDVNTDRNASAVTVTEGCSDPSESDSF